MQGYHRRWLDKHRDRSGLTDLFFASVARTVDRCVEIWIKAHLAKQIAWHKLILPKGKLVYSHSGAFMGQKFEILPRWQGNFLIRWNAKGKATIRLLHSKGYRAIDRLVLGAAKKCLPRLVIPPRLRGKPLVAKLRSEAHAVMELRPLVGLVEQRNPRTGQMYWTLTHPGKIFVGANSILLLGKSIPKTGD